MKKRSRTSTASSQRSWDPGRLALQSIPVSSALLLSMWGFKGFQGTLNYWSRTGCCNEGRNVRWARNNSTKDTTLAQPDRGPALSHPQPQQSPATTRPSLLDIQRRGVMAVRPTCCISKKPNDVRGAGTSPIKCVLLNFKL